MDTLTRENLGTLIRHRDLHCVSIFMPAHRAGPEIRQDPIRLKNLLGKAEERLAELGVAPSESQAILDPAAALLRDSSFWRNQGNGLALFLSPKSFHHYRLPIDFQELLVVTDRFHLKPLLPLFAQGSRFFVLALSQNEVKLFRGSPPGLVRVELGAHPGSLAETLQLFDEEKQGEINTDTAMIHYCKSVDKEVCRHLANERAPLVLAAVESLLGVYRQASTYPLLMDEGIYGNPEHMNLYELHARGQAVARTAFLKVLEATADRYRRNVGTDRTSDNIEAVLYAANQGKVAELVVAVGVQCWGAFDPATESIRIHEHPEPGDEDLLNLAAVLTIAKGGEVFAVQPEDVPGGEPVAAVFRY